MPVGWTEGPLAETCQVIQGQSPPGSTYNDAGNGLPFYQGKAEFGDLYPTPWKWCSAPTKIAEKGDVLLSVRAPVGPTNLCPARSCIGRGLAAIRPKDGILPMYVLYALRSLEPKLASMGTGSTFKAISGNAVRGLQIPLAPLSEQRRIVAAIEEHLSRLDAAVAALERVRATLPSYRAALLKAGCQGKLAGTKRPSEWRRMSVADLISDGPQNGLYLPRTLYGRGTPIIRIEDFGTHGSRTSSELRRAQTDANQERTFALRDGDVLLNRVNSPSHLGKCLLIESRHLPAVFESNMMRMRTTEDIDPRYMVLFLQSPVGRSRLLSNAKWAVNQASINQKDVGNVSIELPPREEQRAILAEVDRRLSLADAAERTVTAGLAKAKRLRQAILKRAFEGKLVPQDPNDEPASVLLERIKAGRR